MPVLPRLVFSSFNQSVLIEDSTDYSFSSILIYKKHYQAATRCTAYRSSAHRSYLFHKGPGEGRFPAIHPRNLFGRTTLQVLLRNLFG